MSGDSRSRRSNRNGGTAPQERDVILGVELGAEGPWMWVVGLQKSESALLLSTRDGTNLPRAKESPWYLLWAMVTDTHVLFTLPGGALPCIAQMGQYTYTQYSVVICIKTLVFCYISLFNKTMSLPRSHSKERESVVNQICTDFYFMQNYLKHYKIENIKRNKRKRAT